MTTETKKTLNDLLSSLKDIDFVHLEDIPNIDLYMDQVTTFMDEQLKGTKRYEDDKILTKTMINNYAKNHLLPPPEKKKYSKEHVLMLTIIYYFKNILSIKDIETLLKPLTDKYFGNEEGLDIADIYEEVVDLEKSRIGALQREVAEYYHDAKKCFEDAPEEDRDYLQLFAFLCEISFDVYAKKMIVEHLIDNLAQEEDDGKKTGEKKTGEKKTNEKKTSPKKAADA